MKILHTSDWHLGRGISGHDLSGAQSDAINFIVEQAIERKIDVLIVAGDVYDLQRPAVSDILTLRGILTRLSEAGIKIILTAGNHDSGPRLAANSNLLANGLHIAGLVEESGQGIQIDDEHGPVVFYPLPFLDPNEARFTFKPIDGDPLERSHQAVMTEALNRVRTDLANRPGQNVRSVVIAHAFVVKGGESIEELQAESCESERDLSVGGVQTIKSSAFDGVNYVALGHLHGPREVGTTAQDSPAIRYSGSILRYSLSEANHTKSFTVIDLDAQGRVTNSHIEIVEIPQPRGMSRLRGPLEELLSDKYASNRTDFVELTVVENHLPENYAAQLNNKFTHILSTRTERPDSEGILNSSVNENAIEIRTPIQIMSDFYQHSTGEEANDNMLEILRDTYEEALKQVNK
jgi:exonuclease SbcD